MGDRRGVLALSPLQKGARVARSDTEPPPLQGHLALRSLPGDGGWNMLATPRLAASSLHAALDPKVGEGGNQPRSPQLSPWIPSKQQLPTLKLGTSPYQKLTKTVPLSLRRAKVGE